MKPVLRLGLMKIVEKDPLVVIWVLFLPGVVRISRVFMSARLLVENAPELLQVLLLQTQETPQQTPEEDLENQEYHPVGRVGVGAGRF